MPAMRSKTEAQVNAWFDEQVQPHRDAAWARKRDVAKAGAPYPDAFAQEAALRGLTPTALADLVLSKPDSVAAADARELHRQRVNAAIDAAKMPAELDAILAGLK